MRHRLTAYATEETQANSLCYRRTRFPDGLWGKRRNNALRIWASTPQNCATTSQIVLDDRRLWGNIRDGNFLGKSGAVPRGNTPAKTPHLPGLGITDLFFLKLH